MVKKEESRKKELMFWGVGCHFAPTRCDCESDQAGIPSTTCEDRMWRMQRKKT
jgi:hypothetical protein